MSELSFNQIRAQVAAVRKKIPDSPAIAIRSHHRWNGELERRDGDEVYLIHQCDSPLAMRVALRGQPAVPNDRLRHVSILITDLDDEQIGDDILVRLKPRKVVPLDNWQIVKSLFQAREIDPRVTGHPWIAAALMDYGAMHDCPTATSGFLDAETVWQLLLRRLIGFEGETPDLLGLLKWSTAAENVGRWRSLEEPVREAARQWIVGLAGPTADVVLRVAYQHEKPDALPIGLAAGVVHHPEAKGQLEKASGKLEAAYLAGETPGSSIIKSWYAAASDVVHLGISDGGLKQPLLARGDEIMVDVGAASHAWLSGTSPIGFDQRLARFGERLSEAVAALKRGTAELATLAAARQLLNTHDRAARERRRMARVQMAMRLVQWLLERSVATEPTVPGSLAAAAGFHLRESGFVDWARLALRAGDPVQELSQGYSKLFDQVTNIRDLQSKRFAELLVDWTASQVTDNTLIPVEQILDRVVAPIAEKNPVLVIVVDGMSVAVFRELMNDVLGNDWALLAEEEMGLRCGLATIPSVTEVSRASLLCGTLVQGAQANERQGFAEHPGLVEASRSTHPPVLFHKGSLQAPEDASLAAEIRKEIGSSHRKVVGVVVNAVDDHLHKGDQIDTRWTHDEIRMLPALLHEAKMSRRTVILLSDHGHILDCNAKGKKAEGGERWRFDENDAAELEMQITGPRVVIPESKKLIAPWSEKLRYGVKKNGYHGGLTPQEMVVPIAVLSTSDSFPTGWTEATVDLPVWWNEPVVPEAGLEEADPIIKPQPKKPPETLFDLEEVQEPSQRGGENADGSPGEGAARGDSATHAAWIEALLESPIFEQQKSLGGRSVPGDKVFAKLLSTLDARGGKMISPALAGAIGFSSMRLHGLLAVAGRVLNIDGYAVLTRDEASDTVVLDRKLLCRQFDLTEE